MNSTPNPANFTCPKCGTHWFSTANNGSRVVCNNPVKRCDFSGRYDEHVFERPKVGQEQNAE